MAEAERMCAHCGRQFGFMVKSGPRRAYCDRRCAKAAAYLKARNSPPSRLCAVDQCGAAVRSPNASHCEMHYGRLRRNGSLASPERKGHSLHSGGYVVSYVTGHQLETPGQRGRIYEHRRVYHAEHGDGPFSCYHCGETVTWADMHVDHLNDKPDDNEPSNLVASCPTCNQRRGVAKMAAAQRASGRQVTAFGQTQCVAVWSKQTGVPRATISRRLAEGWPTERAVAEAPGLTGRKAKRVGP